jgi:hypothetical protein
MDGVVMKCLLQQPIVGQISTHERENLHYTTHVCDTHHPHAKKVIPNVCARAHRHRDTNVHSYTEEHKTEKQTHSDTLTHTNANTST